MNELMSERFIVDTAENGPFKVVTFSQLRSKRGILRNEGRRAGADAKSEKRAAPVRARHV